MGRKLEFNRDVALTKATKLFWKRGYVNTSLAQLLKAMGVGEGSFYNTFKSKKRLYLECLRHYNRTFMARRSAALSADRPAVERIKEFFEVVIEEADSQQAGCLVSNSLTNEVLSEAVLKSYLFDGFESFLEHLESVIVEGQRDGEIDATVNPKVAARVLFTYMHGLHRLSVYGMDRSARRREARMFVSAVLPST